MKNREKFTANWASRVFLLTLLTLFLLFIYACGSSTETESADSSNTFIANGSNTGSIDIDINRTRLAVSETSGFKVTVTDQFGAPVRNIPVSCDTEIGLAILEPSTGTEFTDSNGVMSGVMGCSQPGSYQMMCEFTAGFSQQRFVDIICEGGVPSGFTGFGEGAGGGGLGTGGSTVTDDGAPGGVGNSNVRITDIGFSDGGSDGPFIDTSRRNCETDPEADPQCEIFTDSLVTFTISNNSNQNLRFTGYNYTVPNAFGTGASFTSKTLAISPLEISGFGDQQFTSSFFAEAVPNNQEGACTLGKRFPDASSLIPTNLGFRNVTFRIFGNNEAGEEFTITGTTAVSFSSIDRC